MLLAASAPHTSGSACNSGSGAGWRRACTSTARAASTIPACSTGHGSRATRSAPTHWHATRGAPKALRSPFQNPMGPWQGEAAQGSVMNVRCSQLAELSEFTRSD
eukprot:9960105-Alexandrium_andersonii.AAC.1